MRSGILRAAAVGAVGILAAGTVGGCSATGGESSDGVSVITTVYPLEWLAERVGGDSVALSNLTQPGVDPHDLELTARQVGSLGSADIVFFIDGMQPAVDDAVHQQAADAALAVNDLVELREVPEENGGGLDPHMWLDPNRLSTVAEGLGERLAEVDPDNADTYRSNAAGVATELTEIDADYRSGLAQCATRDMVVSHAAFGYLADNYDLQQTAITGIEPDTEPSPARMAEVARLVKERDVSTVFTETLVSPAVAQTIAEEAGVQTAVLDPLEGITDESSGTDYPSVMRANLETLRSALDCS
ncbi:metal ABC transporter substrate-binding protein [Nocardiopsis ansamitocini]|uniref:metal ABC transporter substrate-binding protein n=1 Tax=Nocardiopsis ansamitocini TaxID=1670832 RepID=UPI0025550E03|nr:metal ABC transporter substrate-binding protein [Nocardiopsis ansamitocini]